VNTRIGGGGGGPTIRPQQEPTVQKKDTKETKDSKGAKGAEAKGDVKGGGQTGGIKAKGKAKSKDLGEVGGLLAGNDSWALEDEGDNRKRRSRTFFDKTGPETDTLPEDFDPELSMLENVPAAFRGQVAQGMAAARSFTRGGRSTQGADDAADEEEFVPERPARRQRIQDE